jgi:AraC family ethanolamine operon transcriptional activator
MGVHYGCCIKRILKLNWYNDSFDFKIAQNFKYSMMTAPIEQVLDFAEKAGYPLHEKEVLSQGVITYDSTAHNYLSDYLKELLFLAKNEPEKLLDPVMGSSLSQLIISDTLPLFLDVLTNTPSLHLPEKESRYRQLAKDAETYIQNYIEQPITLQKLCENLHTSQRALNYAFKAVYDLSPMEYLKVLRLNQVCHALRASDPVAKRVTEIATRFGFWHMGQFSADYKKMFGETPSKTLKRK